MKEKKMRCEYCMYLIKKGKYGRWYCKEKGKDIELISDDKCPALN